jgi:hypothetical protein
VSTATGAGRTSYAQAAARMDAHMGSCWSCSSGAACGAGDDAAELEARTFTELAREDPVAARREQMYGAPQ